MDIVSEARRKELERIEHQYREGDIAQEQAMAWLLQAIEQEIQKPDAEIDDAWIDACEHLMDSIEQPQEWPDHRQENWAVIQAGMRKARRDMRIRQAVRVACVAACLMLMLVGVSYSRQWFQGEQSPDEQVYTLSGQQVEIGTATQAVADGNETWKECETDDFQELCDFLGYVPQMPTWVPEGWVLNSYYAVIDWHSQQISVAYENPEQKYLLIYEVIQTEDVSSISAYFYQDAAGEKVQLENGLDIYLTTNTGDPVAVWTTSSTYACATGPVTVDDLQMFILGIQ